jgi:hypothetical protein
MLDAAPVSWLRRTPGASFHALAEPSEFRVFQVGVFAGMQLDDVAVSVAVTDSTITVSVQDSF